MHPHPAADIDEFVDPYYDRLWNSIRGTFYCTLIGICIVIAGFTGTIIYLQLPDATGRTVVCIMVAVTGGSLTCCFYKRFFIIYDGARWTSFRCFVRYDVPMAVALVLVVEGLTSGGRIRSPACYLGVASICAGQICFLAEEPERFIMFPVMGLLYACPRIMLNFFDAADDMQVYCTTGERDLYLRSLVSFCFGASCIGMTWLFLKKAQRTFSRFDYKASKSICGFTIGSLAALSGLHRAAYSMQLYRNTGVRNALLWSIAYASVGVVGTGVSYFYHKKIYNIFYGGNQTGQ